MRSNTILMMALAGCLCGGPSFAQSGNSGHNDGRSITKEETIVIRKGPSAKTVVEIKDGNVYVNGEVVATVQDAASGKVHKKIVIEGSREDGNTPMPFMDDQGDHAPRRAMLGVLTEPKEGSRGAAVREVTPNGAAAKAGLQAGDRITKVDGENIGDPGELVAAIGQHASGDKVTITYERDGKTQTAQATLMPAQPESMARIFRFGPGGETQDFGDLPGDMPNAMIRPFPFAAGEDAFAPRPRLGITAEDRADGSGVRVLNVKPESPAARAGLKAGDVIRKVGDEQVGSVDELQMSLRDIKPNESVKLEYQRDGRTSTATVTLPRPIRQREF